MSRKNSARHSNRRSKKNKDVEYLKLALEYNGSAKLEGPSKKTWNIKDLKNITPLTTTQREVFESWYSGASVCATGSAGTGKTYVGCFLALTNILERIQDKIIIVRSAVSTRDVGFLPGTVEEKVAEYEKPYIDIFSDIMGRDKTYGDMKAEGLIEFMPTSFIRGLTWDNAVILVDECENMTFHEIDSIMTRRGRNSKVILMGDTKQTDLKGRNGDVCGVQRALRAFDRIDEIHCHEFDKNDIVRDKSVRDWIVAVEDTE